MKRGGAEHRPAGAGGVRGEGASCTPRPAQSRAVARRRPGRRRRLGTLLVGPREASWGAATPVLSPPAARGGVGSLPALPSGCKRGFLRCALFAPLRLGPRAGPRAKDTGGGSGRGRAGEGPLRAGVQVPAAASARGSGRAAGQSWGPSAGRLLRQPGPGPRRVGRGSGKLRTATPWEGEKETRKLF